MHQPAKSEVVVVTGASAGLGRAIAREFGRQGASVGLISRNQERLDAAKKDRGGAETNASAEPGRDRPGWLGARLPQYSAAIGLLRSQARHRRIH